MQSYTAILKQKGLDRPLDGLDHLLSNDSYGVRLKAAFEQICQQDYPAGMIPWLATANPEQYADLTSRIPDEIDRLWNERVPLAQFEAVLVNLVSLHGRCREDYRRAHSVL